jgi:hypothetical protein
VLAVLAVWLLDVHGWFAWVVVAANGVAGLWALGAHWFAELRHRSLWWFTAAAQVAIFVQVVLGVALVAGEGIEAPEMHMFYGFVALVAVGIIYSYRQQVTAHRYLLYGFGGLFLMGLAIRAMVLDAPT